MTRQFTTVAPIKKGRRPKAPTRITIFDCALLVPNQRDAVKLFLPIWFFECIIPAKRRLSTSIIGRDLREPLPSEYHRQRLVPFGHFGMRRGRALVGGIAAHRPLSLLAVGEITTQFFFSHGRPNAGVVPQVPPP